MGNRVVGYARCSMDQRDWVAQRAALLALGVDLQHIYTDQGLTGTNRIRPGLREALAAVQGGDTLVVAGLDRLARSVPDARDIADELVARGVTLALGTNRYAPDEPAGQMFFSALATLAQFEADLIRLRTREGMAIAKANGKLRGKPPKLSAQRQRELRQMHDSGHLSVGDLAELFAISRPTVYRIIHRTKEHFYASA